MCAYSRGVGLTAAAAAAAAGQRAAGRVGGESSSQRGCHRSVTLQLTELGLWPVADSFLTASVCVTGMHNHECKWNDGTLGVLRDHLRDLDWPTILARMADRSEPYQRERSVSLNVLHPK